LTLNISKSVGGPFNIISVFYQVESVEREFEVKTGTGSSFRRYFGKKPILGIFCLFYLRWYVPYKVHIWGLILGVGTKYSGKRSRS